MIMKRLFKIHIILFIVFSIILSGCSKNSNQELSDEISGNNPSIEIQRSEEKIEIYYIENQNSRMSNLQLDNWEEYLSEISGNTFDIKYISSSELMNTEQNQNGERLIYISDVNQINMLKEGNLILPLNEYLPKLNNSKLIPKKLLDSVKDTDGNIWALPTYYQTRYFFRRYDKTWLNNLGLEVPVNISELEELGAKLRSEENTNNYLFAITKSDPWLCYEAMDIFVAFGCYPNIFGLENIVYDQSTNRYIDIATTPEFKEALIFIKHLIEENMVLAVYSIYDQEFEGKKFISGDFIDFDNELDFCWELSGPNTEKLMVEYNNPAGIAVMRGTENISEKLAFFTERAFVEEEIRMALNHGEKGYHFDEYDEYILKYKDNNGELISISPILVNILSDQLNEKAIFIQGVSEEKNKENAELRRSGIEIYEKAGVGKANETYLYNLLNRILVSANDESNNFTHGYNGGKESVDVEILENFMKLMDDVLYNDVAVDIAIGNYINKCNTEEYQNYIAGLNDNL